MTHTLYNTIEDMLRPGTLSTLMQRPITTARLVPFQTLGHSSTQSPFMAVVVNNTEHPAYVLKHMIPERDWVMQMTGDRHRRMLAIWQHGLLDRLPEEIDHAIIACAVDGTKYALLMHNVTDTVWPDGTVLSEEDTEFSLEAMAALHVAFWEDHALNDPALNLCSPEKLFTHTAPERTQQLAKNNSTPILEMILEGWRKLPAFADPDVVDLLRYLARDPAPLCTALADYPQTLVHGDWRVANFGVTHGERSQLILLDWARPTPTVPAVDLAYYLVTSSMDLPISRETAVDLYKQQLARRLGDRFDETTWQPQLELSLLGAFLMIGWVRAWFAAHADDEKHRLQEQKNIMWWSEQVRAGAKWLTL